MISDSYQAWWCFRRQTWATFETLLFCWITNIIFSIFINFERMLTYLSLLISLLWSIELKLVTKNLTLSSPFYLPDIPALPIAGPPRWVIYQNILGLIKFYQKRILNTTNLPNEAHSKMQRPWYFRFEKVRCPKWLSFLRFQFGRLSAYSH